MFNSMTGSSIISLGATSLKTSDFVSDLDLSNLPFTKTTRLHFMLAIGEHFRKASIFEALGEGAPIRSDLASRARKSVQRQSSMRRLGSDMPNACSADVSWRAVLTPPSPHNRHSRSSRVRAPIPCRRFSQCGRQKEHAQHQVRYDRASVDNG